MRGTDALLWIAISLGGLCAAAGGEDPGKPDDLQQENAELRKRLDAVEKEMAEIKGLFSRQAAEIKTLRQAQEKDLKDIRSVLAKDAAAKGTGQKWLTIRTGLDMELYGYIKLDASYDGARTDVGDFARWVEPQRGRGKDDQFNMTARQTRLGLRIFGPEAAGAKTSGRLEIDFYGSGAENKPEPMMRHAYMEMAWPKQRLRILAGQTSDVISPLVPDTLNYSVAWWAGNIGYRRPQVRLTKGFALGGDVDLEVAAAAARTIGHAAFLGTQRTDPGDTGEDACLPGLQGRLAVTFPLLGTRRTTVGFSGHFAREEYDTDLADHGKGLCSWSANMDVTQPVTEWLTIKGELYTGSNLDAYLGGIGQGLNAATLKEIAACGGWGAASLGPWDRWRFNLGASVEAVDGTDVTAAAARTLNRSFFGNVIYDVNKHAAVGLEVSHWHTEYDNSDNADSLRIQTSFIYKF